MTPIKQANEGAGTELPPDLKAYLKGVPRLTKACMRSLEKAGDKLNHDPVFQASIIKSVFVSAILAEMQEQKITPSKLAKKWGVSRQYVQKILNEDKRVNFTIETMTKLAMVFGKQIQIKLIP